MSPGEQIYRYHYRDAVNGFFEFPTDQARAILPGGLQPIEVHHGLSVLTVTAFEFHDSSVGAYREIALSVLTAPRIVPGEPMPRAAMYPFLVGTTTPEARQHGIDVWHLPHHPRDIQVDIERSDRAIRVVASEAGTHILTLTVTDSAVVTWAPVEHRYQTFMHDAEGLCLSPLVMTGPFMENEEERGALALGSHAFTAALDPDDVTTTPFREQWMKQGVESIYPLQRLAAFVGR